MVWIRCWFWRTLKICWSTYNLGPYPPVIALNHLTSLPRAQLFPTLRWKTDRLRELVQLFFMKENGKCRYKYLVLGKDRFYFVKKKKKNNTKKHLCFYQKVLWNWSHRNARLFDWHHICYVWWTCFSTDSWHSCRYKLCSSFRRRVPLFIWCRPDNLVDCYGISMLQITTDMFHSS